MQNFQDTFETRKRSSISVLSICMTVPLRSILYILFLILTEFPQVISFINEKKLSDDSTFMKVLIILEASRIFTKARINKHGEV